ncbi:MAG TPA: hypothetical protein DCZ92_09680 [Elusimicrobia bacterium]|nr:MAG: hypothetical protein A2016_10740 [Elusimicrobia bacterium GWF2_62_30]HBA61070.1 hypothetical protein [Elusimicrobiota bacterium]
MRIFFATFFSFLFLLLPFPTPAFADADSDLSDKFKTRIKAARDMSDGAAQWEALAKHLAGDPLFAALGLDKLTYLRGNQLTYDYTLNLGGAALDLNGTLTFDPAPADGAPTATLTSKTEKTDGDLIDIGALRSNSATLQAAIYKENGGYKVYARLLPNFTNYNRDPQPALLLAKSKGVLDFALVGANLTVSDLAPYAGRLPFLDKFVFAGLARAGDVYTIKGSVNGKDVACAVDNAKKSIFLTGKGLALSDIIPEAANLPVLNEFAFESFTKTDQTLAVAGTLNGKKTTVARGPTKNSFVVTGAALQLADLVPAAAGLHVLDRFTFNSLTWTPQGLTVSGAIGGKAVSVAADSSGQELTVTGDDLKLADVIPAAAQVPCVNGFALDSVRRSASALAVTGKLNGRPVAVSENFAEKRLEMSGPGLSLPACVPLSLNLPGLHLFNFGSLFHWPDRIEVDGTIDGKAVKFVWVFSPKVITVTGDSLKLADFLPETARLPFLGEFAFLNLKYTDAVLTVNGTVNAKSVAVTRDNDKKTVKLTGDDLKLADLVPEASQLPFLDAFALDTVKFSTAEFIVTGKVNGKGVTVEDPPASNLFRVTGDALTLGDFIPQTRNLPYLQTFAFTSLSHTADGLEAAGRMNGKAVLVSRPAAGDSFTVKGDGVKLADLIPAAAKLSYLNNFTFTELVYTEASLQVAGTVNGKNISVTQDNALKTFTVKGSALQLADFVPQAARLPYLQKFDVNSVVQRPNGALVAGDVDGKALTVDADMTANTFKITGADLLLKDFVPQAAGFAYLDNFKFDSLLSTLTDIEVSGKVNGKAVVVKKTLDAPDFSVTGDDLQLADFIPAAAQVPCVNAFALDSVQRSAAALAITGKVNGKPVAVSDTFAENRLEMSGPGLSLPACMPLSLNIPGLNLFNFGSLFHWPDRIEVDGTVNGKAVKLVWVFSPKVITVTGDSLKLADFLPETAKLPFLGNFAFLGLKYSDAELAVNGTVNGKNVAVAQDNAKKTVLVTGDDLKLADFVPEAADVPFLKAFAFDSLSYSQAAVVVDGKLNGKKVSVTKPFGPGAGFTAAGEGLLLKDLVPEAGGLKAFDAVALNLVTVSPAAVEVAGTLNGKAVKFVRTRGDKPVSTITADGLVLGDIYAPLAGLPVISAVAMEKISLDGTSVEAAAKIGGLKADVIARANQGANDGYVAVYFNSLSAATFIPAAQGHLVNDLSLDNALFVIQPAGSPARALTAAELPGDLPKLVGWPAGVSMNLSEGVNIAAWITVAKSAQLTSAFKALGVTGNSLLVKGTLPPSAFKGMGGAQASAAALPPADKQALLAGLNLSVELPLPALPAVAGLVTVKGPVILSIGGDAAGKSSLWARVPKPIAASKPAGDLDVSVQFQLDVTGAGIGEQLDALVNLDKGARGGLSLLAVYEGAWKQPFGIQGLTLTDGGFEFALEGKGPQASGDLAFFATALIGAKNVAVSADLKRADGKISLDYFQLDGKFRLADFPGGKNIPGGDKFELDQLKLSPNGIEAKTVLGGKKTDAFLFNAGTDAAPNWLFAVSQKNFRITELLPAGKAIKPLGAMVIPQAALILSEKGLKNADRSALGVIAKDMFDEILGKSAYPLNLPDGVALLAAFDPGAMGAVGKGLNAIGVHDDAVIMGAVTGVFQGAPGFLLALNMETVGETRGLPGKVMTFKPGVPPSFFLQWAAQDFYAGLRAPMQVKAGKELLDFTTEVELQFGEAGTGVKVLGAKDGPWKQPFGIKGLTINNVKMDVAITPLGEVQFGLAGDQQYGNCHDLKSKDCVDVDLAMSVKVALADGLPDGVAFAGKVNPLGIPALMEITETLMGAQPGSMAKLPVPFFQINDAQLAFATPGASDPQLGLVGDGFAFAGDFFFMNQSLGRVRGSGGPAGTAIKGAIGDINLDVLKFTNGSIDIALGPRPRYAINADVTLLGAPQHVVIDIKPPSFQFDMTEKLGAFGSALLTVRMDGFDLEKGTFDKNAGVSVTGEFKSTLVPWMKAEVKKGVEELRLSAKAKFEEDTKALKEAQAKVEDLNDKIQKLKAEDQKAKDRADDALNSAQSRVNSLLDKHDHEDHEAHHCGSKWTHWACSPGWRIAAAATWVIYEVADKTLDAAKKAVAAATNLDPRVAALIAERDIERAGLAVAEAVVKVTEDVEDFVMKELETVLEKAVADMPLEIDKTFIVGDLKDMVTHNDPLVLDMQFKLVGDPMHEYFAVKIPDRPENAAFDATSFALLPALALDKLTEDALKKLSPQAARWVHAHIATQLADAEDKVRQAVEAQEEKYKSVLGTFESGTEKYKKAFAEQADDHLKLVEEMDVSDLMPNSLEYSNIYLAIGHSNLCLAVSKDGLSVAQLPCHDTDVQQWNTVALKDDAEGYVELKNKGLCLKARQGDDKDSFEPLVLAQCDAADRHEQWKIISADGFYDEIVNRFSQKCLHFNTEDANPVTAYAVWTSCLGADSQTFRDITDAEKPTWHNVASQVKAANGLCLDVVEETENILKLTPQKKEIKLYAHKCGDGSEKFNYVEEVDGDIRLVHTETGACVYPQEKADSLAMRACDRGEDMFWRINAKSASADQFMNVKRNFCLALPAPAGGSTRDQEAMIVNCNITPNDSTLLDFTK